MTSQAGSARQSAECSRMWAETRKRESIEMERFEAVVFAQQPAKSAWTPVTDYSFEARKEAEGPHPQLIKDVFCPTGVWDVGAGPGHLVRLLNAVGVPTLGLDSAYPLPYGLWRQPPDCVRESILNADAFTGDMALSPRDLVICREVLEHLTLLQARVALTHLCRLSKRYVYITTRFSSEHDLMRVETSDDLDPTHITLPAKDLYRLLLTLEGFKRRTDLETAMDWKSLGRCLVYERVA